MRLFIRWIIIAISLWVAVLLVPGLSKDGNIWTWLLVAAIFGLVNAIIRPIVLLLSCPLVVLTLGLFVLIVNWAMLSLTIWISSSVFNLGFTSDGFWATFFGAIVISIVSGVLNIFLRDDKEDKNTIIVQR
ncbi:MAG: phage holin family protein [Ardenticatenaceae bacterium]|nr:phage holin family protein [Ardenticatenaceae bacterium]MCB8988424.1 phage holin family protein [Ardenticatenaceae bacterium]